MKIDTMKKIKFLLFLAEKIGADPRIAEKDIVILLTRNSNYSKLNLGYLFCKIHRKNNISKIAS